MFKSEPSEQFKLNVDDLLKNYLYLDKNLFKQQGNVVEQGDACFKKFSNEGKGIALPLRMKLDKTATAIRAKKFTPEDRLAYIDVLTLYANHLDQQRFNEKPEPKEKERLVLNLLEAAYTLEKEYDYTQLEQYSARELSSHAQLLHYLGKARRYDGVSVADRFVLLQNALKIAKYLSGLNCNELDDPHHYENRIATYEWPIVYCLQDMKEYDKAAEIVAPQLQSSSAFHRAQAYVQLANIYLKKHDEQGAGIDVAEQHAQQALSESLKPGSNSLINYNARICLMNVYSAADKTDEALIIAHEIISEMDENTECGAKPDHRKAAEKIISSVQRSMACN